MKERKIQNEKDKRKNESIIGSRINVMMGPRGDILKVRCLHLNLSRRFQWQAVLERYFFPFLQTELNTWGRSLTEINRLRINFVVLAFYFVFRGKNARHQADNLVSHNSNIEQVTGKKKPVRKITSYLKYCYNW